ncbi:MAG: hypothetical protein MPJ50_00600 [Pirellulales bacterium]|nr:hypothetical protein [Pirellulales bacterium]
MFVTSLASFASLATEPHPREKQLSPQQLSGWPTVLACDNQKATKNGLKEE